MKSVGKERRCFSSIISATAVLLFFEKCSTLIVQVHGDGKKKTKLVLFPNQLLTFIPDRWLTILVLNQSERRL